MKGIYSRLVRYRKEVKKLREQPYRHILPGEPEILKSVEFTGYTGDFDADVRAAFENASARVLANHVNRGNVAVPISSRNQASTAFYLALSDELRQSAGTVDIATLNALTRVARHGLHGDHVYGLSYPEDAAAVMEEIKEELFYIEAAANLRKVFGK